MLKQGGVLDEYDDLSSDPRHSKNDVVSAGSTGNKQDRIYFERRVAELKKFANI